MSFSAKKGKSNSIINGCVVKIENIIIDKINDHFLFLSTRSIIIIIN